MCWACGRRSSRRSRFAPATIRSTCFRRARALVKTLDTGDGVLIFSDIYGATPCNLATKLLQPGKIEGIAGVNLPMLVRAFTYRSRGMDTMIKKAISGGCDGVLHVGTDSVYATTRN